MLASAASASGSSGGSYILGIALVTNLNLLKAMILPMGHLELLK